MDVTITKARINKPPNTIIILGIYRPPSCRCEWFDTLNDLLIEVSSLGQIIILGDLNADLNTPAPTRPHIFFRHLELSLLVSNSPNKMLNHRQTEIDVLLDEHAPYKSFPQRKHCNPWYNNELKHLITSRDSIAHRNSKLNVISAEQSSQLKTARKKAKSVSRIRD